MNEITRKSAQTATELASARQQQKTGRPSWSARWRVPLSSGPLARADPSRVWFLCRGEGADPGWSSSPARARCPAQGRQGEKRETTQLCRGTSNPRRDSQAAITARKKTKPGGGGLKMSSVVNPPTPFIFGKHPPAPGKPSRPMEGARWEVWRAKPGRLGFPARGRRGRPAKAQ